MAYNENWKNILDALNHKIAQSFKCPVYNSFKKKASGNQLINLKPVGSNQIEKATFLEVREYNIECEFYFLLRDQKDFEDYVLTQVNRLEALIHDNITLDLADNSKAVNVTMGSMEFNLESEENP